MKRTRFIVWLIVCATLVLFACETAEVVRYVAGGSNAPPPQSNDGAPAAATSVPVISYDWVPANTPRCSIGDASISVIDGSIYENGSPVPGQRVQASSGPGAEPITDDPAESDENGNFQVTLVCDGRACDGAFWIWIVNENNEQVSPFIQFIFDDRCRRGTVEFVNP